MTNQDDFLKEVHEIFEIAVKFKAVMNRKNLKIAWTNCPKCNSRLNGMIIGNKNHFHMRCSNPNCNVLMME